MLSFEHLVLKFDYYLNFGHCFLLFIPGAVAEYPAFVHFRRDVSKPPGGEDKRKKEKGKSEKP